MSASAEDLREHFHSLVDDLGFTRSQVTEGILWGFILAAPFSFFLGAFIDRYGPQRVILWGLVLVGFPLVLMGWMSKVWQYYALSIAEVLGYILAGPIPNQVLVSNWFEKKRGRAMGWAYLGLGAFVDYIFDDYPAKQGLLSPGLHIPIVPSKELYERRPDAVIVFAWRYHEPIARKHSRFLAEGGRFIVPMPELQVL